MPLSTTNWSNVVATLNNPLTDHQIQEMGYDAVWRKGMVCPNRITTKENHDLNCTLCDGTGFVYETDGTCLKVLFTSISMQQVFQSFGRFDMGMAMATVQSAYKLSWWDRLDLTTSVIRYNEVIKRTANSSVDKCKYTPVCPILLVDSTGAYYKSGEHYSINNNTVVWLTNARPKAYYSFAYTCHPRYIVMDLAHHFRDSPKAQIQQTFPVQATVKLDFLIGDESRKAE